MKNSSASEQRVLPDVFFAKCEGSVAGFGMNWLVKFDRKNKTSQIKIPYVDNGYRICSENVDEIRIKRDCEKGIDELNSTNGNGSFQKSNPCKILDVHQNLSTIGIQCKQSGLQFRHYDIVGV